MFAGILRRKSTASDPPGRAVQEETIWSIEVPLRAGVMPLPGLLKGKHLPFNVPLCSISGLLLAAHKVIVVLG